MPLVRERERGVHRSLRPLARATVGRQMYTPSVIRRLTLRSTNTTKCNAFTYVDKRLARRLSRTKDMLDLPDIG